MTAYLLRLLILLPMVGGLAWGSLWLWRRVQGGLPLAVRAQQRPVRLIDAVPLGQGGRLALVRFDGRDLLIAVSRAQIALVAESRAESAGG